jgi:Kef-type K+ transport system membrane component KefB
MQLSLQHLKPGPVICACALPLALASAACAGNTPADSHGDPFAEFFLVLALLLVSALAGRYGARKLSQSPVLGELVIGIIIGAALYQMGSPAVIIIRHNDLIKNAAQIVLQDNETWEDAVRGVVEKSNLPEEQTRKIEGLLLGKNLPQHINLARSLTLISSLGVLLLLFMAGLESSVDDMIHVGGSAVRVALAGVILPFMLGYGATRVLLPDGVDTNCAIFIGAALCATSIGITARVFKDMNRLGMLEARIILGAAVLDDVLGLIILAVVSGIVTSGSFSFTTVAVIALKACVFTAAVMYFGRALLNKNIALFARLDQSAVKLLYPFCLLMIFSWLADAIGLATIVGAFAAGLIISEESFPPAQGSAHGRHSVESIMAPLEGICAPVFFVLMGFQVDVSTFGNSTVLLTGLALSIAAVIGKVAAALPVGKGVDRLVVGIGMVPRGEVGLIFAGIGKTIGVLDNNLFSIIIIVVILTTLVTPPLLKWAIERRELAIQ